MGYDDDDWAVFWCSLLGPILLEEVTAGERGAYLKQLSRQEVTLPGGRCKRLSYSTLRRKVRQFRQRKIAGMPRRRRRDRGQARKQRKRMIVGYDPFSSGEEVRLTSLRGVFLGVGRRYDRERGAHPEPPPAPPQTPLDHEYLKLLAQEHQQQQQAERGVDYHQARRRHLLSFPGFGAPSLRGRRLFVFTGRAAAESN